MAVHRFIARSEAEAMKYSVSGLTAQLKSLVEKSFPAVTVEGEITNCKFSSTGHLYFSLKDNSAKLSCALFRSDLGRVPFMPQDGQQVTVSGSISLYPPSGNYQLICKKMVLAGDGELLKLIEKRKQKYASLGYFDDSLKKAIPRFPKRIAVVTSPTGAAVMDILNVVKRRNSGVTVRILPAAVQGAAAAGQIAEQIRRANRYSLADVIIIGRGGGSLEDLLPFSEDSVIEAVHKSSIPVISAVGHEIDIALSDFAADLRSPTPSAAAEMVTGEIEGLLEYSSRVRQQLTSHVKKTLALSRMKLNSVSSQALIVQLKSKISDLSFYIDDIKTDIARTVSDRISHLRHRILMINTELTAKSPIETLKRGYAIIELKPANLTATSVSQLTDNRHIGIRMHDGSTSAVISPTTKKNRSN